MGIISWGVVGRAGWLASKRSSSPRCGDVEDSMLKKLATEMLLIDPTPSSSSVPVSLVIEADLADLHTFAR